MSQSNPFRAVDQQVFDVVIFGGGYAGYAAAQRLHARSLRVLLVERRATLLHQSGWGFFLETGTSAAPEWQALLGELSTHGGIDRGLIDGGIAEVIAAERVARERLQVLFYMQPLAAWRDASGRVGAVAVAGKGGVRVLRASRWIDATEEGELLAILNPGWQPPAPARQSVTLVFRGADWRGSGEAEFAIPGLDGARAAWRHTRWDSERALVLDLPGAFARFRTAWLPALEALHGRQPELMRGAVLTHATVEPVAIYGASPVPALPLPENVIPAIASAAGRTVRTLADRFDLGLAAADAALAAPAVTIQGQPPFEFGHDVRPERRVQTQVAVAGAGTGGAFAALAAAREGAQVLAFDPLPFVGGIGTGGGIHIYYYGVRGGLQEEVDQRTQAIMHLFGRVQQVVGFHPDAKKLVLENMLVEAGVKLVTGSTLFAVQAEQRAIQTASITTPAGPITLGADAWIDATGDGDLAALAGAPFQFGRAHDGQLHAYTQSSGRAYVENGEARMRVVNYDAGFVDPTDAQDLTRARLMGVRYYLQKRFTDSERPTYIAPAIGLRQGRLIHTRYTVTLADLIERREFPDVVGLTGAHYDNHAVDYEFESDEAMFWVWGCRQWRARTACQMPYRMMLPINLDNVWIACRAAGVSEEAHHSLRMQRDFQRLGEVAGLAAALATAGHVSAPEVPYDQLRSLLQRSGALELKDPERDAFGAHLTTAMFGGAESATPEQVARWIDEVRKDFGQGMFKLMRAGAGDSPAKATARQAVMEMLGAEDESVSWRAATIVAMWSDPAAEPRMLKAIRAREYGFSPDLKDRPEQFNRVVPNWMVAVALLRRCGTGACAKDLWELSGDATLLHNQRTTLALTCQHLLGRAELTDDQKTMLLEAVRRLVQTPTPNAVGNPQRKPAVPTEPVPPREDQWQPVIEDFSWQLHLAVAKAELAAGVPIHEQARVYLADPRALVRRAFHQVFQQY